MQTMIIGDEIYIDGKKLPPLPIKTSTVNVTTIGSKIYVNGFEYKDGKWKRTLAALCHSLWHYLF